MSRRESKETKESKDSEQKKSASSSSTDPSDGSKKKRGDNNPSESQKKPRTSNEKDDSEDTTIPVSSSSKQLSSGAKEAAQIHAIYNASVDEANATLTQTIQNLRAEISAIRQENNDLDSELTRATNQIASLTAEKLEREQELNLAQSKLFLVDVDPDSVQKFVAQFPPDTATNPAGLMSESVAELLDNHVTAHFNQRYDWRNSWTPQYLCSWLQSAFHPSTIRADKSLLERLQSFQFDFDFNDPRVLNQSLLRLIQIEKRFPSGYVAVHQASACKFLVEIKLKNHPDSVLSHAAGQMGLNINTVFPTALSEFRERLLQIVTSAHISYAQCAQFATVQLPGKPTPADTMLPKATSSAFASALAASQPSKSSTSKSSQASKASKISKSACTVCGRNHPPGCRFLNPDGTSSWHPNANLTTMPWSQSVQGIQYLEKTKLHTLAFTISADGTKVTPPADNPVHKELAGHSKR